MNYKLAMFSVMPFAIIFLAIYLSKMFNNFQMEVGVYDPNEAFISEENIALDHSFIAWTSDTATDQIKQQLDKSISVKRTPLITIEPWFMAGFDPTGENFSEDVAAGKYDVYVDSVCKEIGSFNVEVQIRFGHEMDLETSRYPWSRLSPDEFINIYRYFVDKCRIYAPKTKYIWSPVGNESLKLFWPGDDYVDLVGVSIFSFDEWEIKNYGKVFSFNEIFAPKYDRIKKYGKKIIIPELGVTGSPERKTTWLKEAVKSFYKYPLLSAVVYFNSQDVLAVWGSDVSTPNWSITDQDLKILINK